MKRYVAVYVAYLFYVIAFVTKKSALIYKKRQLITCNMYKCYKEKIN